MERCRATNLRRDAHRGAPRDGGSRANGKPTREEVIGIARSMWRPAIGSITPSGRLAHYNRLLAIKTGDGLDDPELAEGCEGVAPCSRAGIF